MILLDLSRNGTHLRRVANPWKPGIASEFIAHLPELVKQETRPLPVWLYCRKSNCGTDNLHQQKTKAVDDLIALKVLIVGVTAVVESSNIYAHRNGLLTALDAASLAGAVLVALTRCRFIRRSSFDGRHEAERPLVGEYGFLRILAGRVRLATIENPDATPGEIRSYQSKRGQSAKHNRGGRPLKRREKFRQRWLPLVSALRRQGWSLRSIAWEVSRKAGRSVSHAGVSNWLQRGVKVDSATTEPVETNSPLEIPGNSRCQSNIPERAKPLQMV